MTKKLEGYTGETLTVNLLTGKAGMGESSRAAQDKANGSFSSGKAFSSGVKGSGVFTEKQLQDGVFLAYLTGHAEPALGWNRGRAEDVSFMVDAKGEERDWYCRRDLLAFLMSPANAGAFALARRQFCSDGEFLDEFVRQALLPKLMSSADSIPALRESVSFAGQTFCLWAPAPRAGDARGQGLAFGANVLRVVDELPFKRSFRNAGQKVSRRPDLAFFVNGLYLSYAELKNGFTGQSASGSGRRKIAREMVEAAERALRDARSSYEKAGGGDWPGWKSKNLSESVRNETRSALCLYEKAVHLIAADAGKMFVLSGADWVLDEVDAALSSKEESRLLTETIPEKIIASFSELPEIHGLSSSETVLEHLASFFHPVHGIDKEIFFFNQNRKSRTTNVSETLRPRAAQRAMLYRTRKRVEELYRDESAAKISEKGVRARLSAELPDLAPKAADEIVRKSLMHLNGKESHSILLQGSTGLGKTNLIVWIAQDLADMQDASSNVPGMSLFDVTVCLTDRTELRRNLGEEAGRLRATKGSAVEAVSFADLKKAFVDGKKIVVVNIQKFPSLMREAERDSDFAALLKSKRVAFVIDEAHRSQNGEYHETTMELFSNFKSFEGGSKRNLVVCLTATPTDATLARFGEWRPPKFAGDEIRWLPFFSYPLVRAVKDRVVLNPLMNTQKYGDHLQVKTLETLESLEAGETVREPSSSEIYENDGRRRLVAEKAAKIFAVKTMMAVRPPHGSALGSGKAMFVANSVKGAIAYQRHIREALLELSKDPKFADRAEALRECPVLILYSDKQGEVQCSSLNDGKNEEEVQDAFRRKGESSRKDGAKMQNAIIVVVDKLLTGFDEPTLHTIFIDRSMDGVLLYQTASRVNRTAKWKNDCLIVDFSHDGVVSKNLPKVFEKYGGLTVSEFDAMPLLERMNEAYRAFFGAKEVSGLWKAWRTDSKRDSVGAAVALSDELDRLSAEKPDEMRVVRKAGGVWRSAKDGLSGILDFSLPELAAHAESDRRAFVDMVVRKLRQGEMDRVKAKGMVFDVDLVELSEGWNVENLSPEEAEDAEEKPKGGKKKSSFVSKTPVAEILAKDIMESIEEFQEREDRKKEMMDSLRTFVEELFCLVDKATSADNNGYHRKRVVKMMNGDEDYPWDERQRKFRELLNKAVLDPKFVKSQAFRENKKRFWEPALRKSDLLMADYEEWVSKGGAEIMRPGAAGTLSQMDAMILDQRDEDGNLVARF